MAQEKKNPTVRAQTKRVNLALQGGGAHGAFTWGVLDRILEDFARCGLVGEETNKLVAYLAAVSRHLEAPLAIVVQSS